jgi:soluble lytic murein transglycosylase-like protein
MMLAAALALTASLSYPSCIDAVERHYGLPGGIVSSIIRAESGGNALAVNRSNRNGTADYGLMQVNSSHLPWLSRYGIDETRLLHDPCANVAVGSYIFHKAYTENGGRIVPALATYNTGSPNSRVGHAYAARVLGASPVREQAAALPAPNPRTASILVASAQEDKGAGWQTLWR